MLYISDREEITPRDALRDGRGSSPLKWCMFRGRDDTSKPGIQYNLRRETVRSLPQGLAILGVYDELLTVYFCDRTAGLRGWIVGHDLTAATAGQVAVAIGTADVPLIRRALKTLEDVGLLRRVPLPDLADALAHDKTMTPAGYHELLPAPPTKVRYENYRPTQPAAEPTTQVGACPTTSPKRTVPATMASEGAAELGWRDVFPDEPAGAGPSAGDDRGQGPDDPCRDGPAETTRDSPARAPPAASAPSARAPPAAGAHLPRAKGGLTIDYRRTDSETSDGGTSDGLRPSASAPPETLRPASAAPTPGPTTDEPTGDGPALPPDAEGQTPPRPTSGRERQPEPLEPTQADPGGGQGIRGRGGAAVTLGQALAAVTARLPGVLPAGAGTLVEEVLAILYPTEAAWTQAARDSGCVSVRQAHAREESSLAATWQAVLLCGLSMDAAGAVCERAIKAARGAARVRNVKKSRGAIWSYEMNGIMQKRVGATVWQNARRHAKRLLGVGA